MQFIDPRSDYAFKRIFGNDKAHDILISFLNAIMGLTGDRSIEIEVFRKAFDIADRSNMSKEEWEFYDESLVLIQDQGYHRDI